MNHTTRTCLSKAPSQRTVFLMLYPLVLSGGPVLAQCTPQWNASFPGLENQVLAMTTWDPDGAGPLQPVLVAAGSARIVGTDPYHNIAYWDAPTSTWRPLGSGMQSAGPGVGAVHALIVYNGDLIAAGNFVTAGGVAANSIARWSGTIAGGSWQPLGSGIDPGGSGAYSMAIHNGQLMVGGNFFGVGGLTNVGGVALWDGSAWSRMNNGFNQSPSAVCSYAGRAYASGSFSAAVNGNFLNGIGSWASPGPWVSPANGLTFVGLSMTVYNGELIVGGYPGAVNCIMRWNGSAWGNLGGGVPGWVLAMTVFDDGTGPNLIAAGTFPSAGGAPANRIARWNGSTWQAMGSGFPTDVNALTVYNGKLVAGGTFSGINGAPFNYIAAWGCACYANCDASTTAPVLNVLDFSCFLNKFAAGDSYANCDNSTTPPVLNVLDFSCFLNKFAAGCP